MEVKGCIWSGASGDGRACGEWEKVAVRVLEACGEWEKVAVRVL